MVWRWVLRSDYCAAFLSLFTHSTISGRIPAHSLSGDSVSSCLMALLWENNRENAWFSRYFFVTFATYIRYIWESGWLQGSWGRFYWSLFEVSVLHIVLNSPWSNIQIFNVKNDQWNRHPWSFWAARGARYHQRLCHYHEHHFYISHLLSLTSVPVACFKRYFLGIFVFYLKLFLYLCKEFLW